jgi:hypothetical protein
MMLRNPWFRFGVNAWCLGIDASSVIAFRTLKIAGSGVAAEVEVRQMVSEKIETGLALQALALTGGLGPTVQSAVTKVLAHYRRKVCEQVPAGKGISRPWARNFSFSYVVERRRTLRWMWSVACNDRGSPKASSAPFDMGWVAHNLGISSPGRGGGAELSSEGY